MMEWIDLSLKIIMLAFYFLVTFISELAELHQISKDTGEQVFAGTEAMPAIAFPPVVTTHWEEQVLA